MLIMLSYPITLEQRESLLLIKIPIRQVVDGCVPRLPGQYVNSSDNAEAEG